MTSRSWTGDGLFASVGSGSSRSLCGARGPGLFLAPLVCMAFGGSWSPLPCPCRLGAIKKPLRFEHRRGGSLFSDQTPCGACSDETTIIAAEETAALAAYEALPERIIDAGREIAPRGAVKPKR